MFFHGLTSKAFQKYNRNISILFKCTYFYGCFQIAYSEFRAQQIKCFHKFLQINRFYTFEHICHVWNNNLLFFTFSRSGFLNKYSSSKVNVFPPIFVLFVFFPFPANQFDSLKIKFAVWIQTLFNSLQLNLIRWADNSLYESVLR